MRRSCRTLLVGLVLVSLLWPAAADARKRRRRHRPAEVPATEEPAATAPEAESAPPPPETAPPPEASRPAAVRPARPAGNPGADKAGRFMANFKIGPALNAYFGGGGLLHAGAIVLEIGWSVLPSNNAYLLFPLQFQFAAPGGSAVGAVILPLGFQYDIPLPVKNLYIYPRFSIGYAAFFTGGPAAHLGMIAPEFGVKYVLKGRWNFGGEPFSLPVFFNGDGAFVYYRILLSAGVNF